jgi:hypothetical protein
MGVFWLFFEEVYKQGADGGLHEIEILTCLFPKGDDVSRIKDSIGEIGVSFEAVKCHTKSLGYAVLLSKRCIPLWSFTKHPVDSLLEAVAELVVLIVFAPVSNLRDVRVTCIVPVSELKVVS